MNITQIDKKIEELNKKKAELLAEQSKVKTLKIKELKIEVETQIHHKGEMFKEIIIPKGWRLLTANEIIFLFNNYAEQLNLEDTWEFIEQPFNLNKQKDYVARFGAVSGRADLICVRYPSDTGSSLGVRFCRSIK